MRILFGFILTFIFSTSFMYSGSESEVDECGIDNDTFINGEVLVYKLYYNWKFMWIPAGEVKFSVSESPDKYHYNAKGITYPSYDSFFKVRDYYSSTVDKNTLYPSSFLRNIQELNFKKKTSLKI